MGPGSRGKTVRRLESQAGVRHLITQFRAVGRALNIFFKLEMQKTPPSSGEWMGE